jgi:hypothetical protein
VAAALQETPRAPARGAAGVADHACARARGSTVTDPAHAETARRLRQEFRQPRSRAPAGDLATYTSFLTATRALGAATRPDLHVAWGIGGSFEQSVLSIPLLDPSPRYVRYFGDLDLVR